MHYNMLIYIALKQYELTLMYAEKRWTLPLIPDILTAGIILG